MRGINLLISLAMLVAVATRVEAVSISECAMEFIPVDKIRDAYGNVKKNQEVRPPNLARWALEDLVAEKVGNYFDMQDTLQLQVQFKGEAELDRGLEQLRDIGLEPKTIARDENFIYLIVDQRGLHNAIYTLSPEHYFFRSEFQEQSGTFILDLQ